MVARLLVGALVLYLGFPGPLQEWRRADPDYDWSFPRDHWAHEGYKTEWWYFTGQLSTASGEAPRFGYQFTLFKVGVLPEPPPGETSWRASDVLMGHAAITDLETGRHVFSEVVYRVVPMLARFDAPPGPSIGRSIAPAGTDGGWTLDWNGEGFDFEMADEAQDLAFQLSTRPIKPLVFQGPNGYSRKSAAPNHASSYYSMTRLDTQGTISLDDSVHVVSGISWMDKEFSSDPLAEGQIGWDWFSIQLEDGRDLMLFMLRDAEGEVDFSHATVVDAAGRTRFLESDEWTAAPTRHWRSPTTEARYPIGWRLELPGESLFVEVEPLATDQENVSRLVDDLFYWEGAIIVQSEGRELGRGFLELTGYGDGGRPAL